MIPSLLAASLVLTTAEAPSLHRSSELAVGLGVLGASYVHHGGRFGELFVGPAVEGRWVGRGPTADGSFLLTIPSSPRALGLTAAVRLGWTGERFSVVAGPSLQLTPGAVPAMQVLPSVAGSYSFGRWGLGAGVFDLHALAPARLSFETKEFSLGYVAPLGALAGLRLRIHERWGVRLSALAFKAGAAEVAFVSLSATALSLRSGR